MGVRHGHGMHVRSSLTGALSLHVARAICLQFLTCVLLLVHLFNDGHVRYVGCVIPFSLGFEKLYIRGEQCVYNLHGRR